MWYYAGVDVTVPVDFIVNGEFVIPESATATLRLNDGSVDATISNVSLDTSTTSTSVTIPEVSNTLASGVDFEHRYLLVTFVLNAQTYTQTIHYDLIPFVPMTGTPDKVRAILGLDLSELPDTDIDLFRAYLDIKARTDVDISTALTSTGRDSLTANEIINIQAALNVVPSLQLRVAASMQSEDSVFRRFSSMDFNAIENKLVGRQMSLLSELITTTEVAFSIFGVSTPTDPVTNA